ncbi:MAG: hypothetical protein ACXWG6_02345 [Usitatibacter sp.]
MKNPNLHSTFAVILPVALGLGLVYLTIVGRIEPGAAVILTLGLAVLVGVLVFLRDFAADQEMGKHPSRDR